MNFLQLPYYTFYSHLFGYKYLYYYLTEPVVYNSSCEKNETFFQVLIFWEEFVEVHKSRNYINQISSNIAEKKLLKR